MGVTLSNYDVSVLAFGAIAFGIYLLIKGGDWTVNASVFIAERLGLSKLFIGATILSFGTSVPELFTSVNANLQGFPGISLGNVVGSNVANILLVVGVTSLFLTLAARRAELGKDLAIMALATVILIGGMAYGVFSPLLGLIMFGLLVAFVIYQYFTNRIDVTEEDLEGAATINTMWQAVGVLLGGLAVLAIGSEVLVRGAVVAGMAIGVPEAVIGLTVVAFGTSLPELSTCLIAAFRKQAGMVLGNVIGSNTFNILSIIGITAMVRPLPVDQTFLGFDIWFLGILTLVFTLWMLAVGRINRAMGIGLIALYVLFTILQYRDVLHHT